MTNDEAIEIIECGEISNRWGKDGEEVEKMAIEALKQKPCEDAISREAVLDACEQSINIIEAVDRIMELPPVNPQKPKTEVLDKIRAEISEQSRMHMDGDLYIKVSECMQIIDKYKAEGSDKE